MQNLSNPIPVVLCPSHPKDTLILVCLQPNCTAHPLLCFKCVTRGSHAGHPTQSLIEFAEAAENLRYGEELRSVSSSVESKIKAIRLKLLYGLQSLVNCVQGNIEKFCQKMQEKRREIEQKYLATPLMAFEWDFRIPLERVAEAVKTCRLLTTQKQSALSKYTKNIKMIGSQAEKLEQFVCQELNRLEDEVSKLFTQLQSRFPQGSAKKFQWESTLKHQRLSISNNELKCISGSVFSAYACCLGSIEMGDSDDQIYTWAIKAKSIKKYTIFGICNPHNSIHHKFQDWNWNSSGHGHYGLYSSGMIYSSHDERVNSSQRIFRIQTGDIIKFSYKPSKGQLQIQKGDKSEILKVIIGKGIKYRAFAYLLDIGDTVELINS